MKKLLFDNIDRQIILDFYKRYPQDNYWKKPLVVANFEKLRVLKEIQKTIVDPVFDFFNKVDIFLFNAFNKFLKSKNK